MLNGNKIYKVDKNGKKRQVFWVFGLKVFFKGKNSTVTIHEPCLRFRHSRIICGSNCKVSIGHSDHKSVKYLTIFALADNSLCEIGNNFSATNNCKILLHGEPNLSVKIGEDCMFGSNVYLRTSDAHSIINNETGELINRGGSIELGNHVWCAVNTTVLKNVKIADNCVIGTGSIVTKSCTEPNSIYAGTPAKHIKSNINWDRKAPGKVS